MMKYARTVPLLNVGCLVIDQGIQGKESEDITYGIPVQTNKKAVFTFHLFSMRGTVYENLEYSTGQ